MDVNKAVILDIKFDLIYSLLGYGFHYTIETYKELVVKYSHSQTVCIFDIRKESFKQQINSFKLFKVIDEKEKHYKVHVHF